MFTKLFKLFVALSFVMALGAVATSIAERDTLTDRGFLDPRMMDFDTRDLVSERGSAIGGHAAGRLTAAKLLNSRDVEMGVRGWGDDFLKGNPPSPVSSSVS